MKKYYETSKLLIKQFAKEKAGSVLLEFLILISVFGMCAAVVSPTVKDQLAEMFDNQSEDITFGGERGDVVITATPQTNALPAVDASTPTATLKKYKLYFNGNTYVQLPNSFMDFGKGSSDVTIEGWFNFSGGRMAIFSHNGSTPKENEMGFGIYNDRYDFNDGMDYTINPNISSSKQSTHIPSKNSLLHIALVVKGNVITVYENGTSVWTQAMQPRNNITNEQAPQLGMEYDQGLTNKTDFYEGYMYEVRFYSRALTPTEVTNNKSGNTSRTGLLAEYLFDDGAGSVLTDQSGNGNNATIVGSPVWKIQ